MREELLFNASFKPVKVKAIELRSPRGTEGFSLITVLIAIAIIGILAAAFVANIFGSTSTATATTLESYIRAIRNGYAYVANQPQCQTPPTSKEAFINMATDSQCRPDTTDLKGPFAKLYPNRNLLINHYPWDIDFNNDVIVIKDVPSSVGEKVADTLHYCTYQVNTKELLCALVGYQAPTSP